MKAKAYSESNVVANIVSGPTDQEPEYRRIGLSRGKGEYIEIGSLKNRVTHFYEQYPGMGGHYIRGYEGYETDSVIAQLKDCGWTE